MSESSFQDSSARVSPDGAAEQGVGYEAVRQAVGLYALNATGVVRMRGTQARDVLNGVLSNDTRLAAGEACYACLLNDVGRVRETMHVLCLEQNELLILTRPEHAQTVVEAIDYYIFTEDATVEDATEELAVFSLQGPQALSTLVAWSGSSWVWDGELRHAQLASPVGPVRVLNHSRTGELGFDVLLPRKDLEQALDGLKALGVPGVGSLAVEQLRVEAGIPQCEADVNEQVNPLETSILGAVSFDKGCYLGQETIARISFLSKPVRRLVALLADSGGALPVGARIVLDTKDVGWITSTVFSPYLQTQVSLGYVRTDTLARQLPLRVITEQGDQSVQARELPLYTSPALAERPVDAVAPPLAAGHKPQLPF